MSCWASAEYSVRSLFLRPVSWAPSIPVSTAIVVMPSTSAPTITSTSREPCCEERHDH